MYAGFRNNRRRKTFTAFTKKLIDTFCYFVRVYYLINLKRNAEKLRQIARVGYYIYKTVRPNG